MSLSEYLEAEAFTGIQRYHSGVPQDAIVFVGTPRKHPYDEAKLLLILEPEGLSPAIYEFRIADVLSAEDQASPVMENGLSYPVVKLWVQRGSIGIKYVPFEVNEPLHLYGQSPVLHEKLMKSLRT
jgi:hypothetical protein